MARPSKFSPVRKQAILRAVEVGASYEQAALAAGINIDTLAEWRKRFPEFSAELKEAEARGVLGCLRRIEEAASAGTWQAAAWRLERRYPAEWGRRARMEVEQHTTLDMQQLADMQAAIRAALPLPEREAERIQQAAALNQLLADDPDDRDAPAADATAAAPAARTTLPFGGEMRYSH